MKATRESNKFLDCTLKASMHSQNMSIRNVEDRNEARSIWRRGVQLENGTDGFEQNFIEAAHLYRISAELGDEEAQFRLGLMYYHGRGLEKNIILAVMWFILAAIGSQPGSFYDRNYKFYSEYLTQSELAKAKILATEFLAKNGYVNRVGERRKNPNMRNQ